MHSDNGRASEEHDEAGATPSSVLDLGKPNAYSTIAPVGKAEPGTCSSVHPCTYLLKQQILRPLTTYADLLPADEIEKNPKSLELLILCVVSLFLWFYPVAYLGLLDRYYYHKAPAQRPGGDLDNGTSRAATEAQAPVLGEGVTHNGHAPNDCCYEHYEDLQRTLCDRWNATYYGVSNCLLEFRKSEMFSNMSPSSSQFTAFFSAFSLALTDFFLRAFFLFVLANITITIAVSDNHVHKSRTHTHRRACRNLSRRRGAVHGDKRHMSYF